jgi:hypothetical protein
MKRRKPAPKLVEHRSWWESGVWLTELPIRTVSENVYRREHWSAIRRRTKAQRELSALLLNRQTNKLEPPLMVVLTRIAPRRLDDDNLRGACKSVRDSVADWLGFDDGNERAVSYHYEQEQRSAYGVRVEVRQVG